MGRVGLVWAWAGRDSQPRIYKDEFHRFLAVVVLLNWMGLVGELTGLDGMNRQGRNPLIWGGLGLSGLGWIGWFGLVTDWAELAGLLVGPTSHESTRTETIDFWQFWSFRHLWGWVGGWLGWIGWVGPGLVVLGSHESPRAESIDFWRISSF